MQASDEFQVTDSGDATENDRMFQSMQARAASSVLPRPIAKSPAQLVQGGSLRTWSYRSANVDQLQVVLSSDGRPLDADVELWHGPDNTPFKMRVYSENGDTRPFSAVVETPRGPNTVAIRNIGQLEFPMRASVLPHSINNYMDAGAIMGGDVVIGGDISW